MDKQLNWCVGKFVYPSGGSTPLHFMGLSEYQLEPALDIALMVAARTSRLTKNNALLADQSLIDWMNRSAADAVVAVAAAMFPEGAPLGTVLDAFAGAGLQFEVFKTEIGRRLGNVRYTAVVPDALRTTFDLLHDQDTAVSTTVHPEESGPPPGAFDLTIINQHGVLRRQTAPAFDLGAVMERLSGPAVLAWRVAAGADDQVRTTVKGVQVAVPSLGRVLDACERNDAHWRYRFRKGFDDGVFVPEAGTAPTGLLIAYTAKRELPLPRYRPAAERPRDETMDGNGVE